MEPITIWKCKNPKSVYDLIILKIYMLMAINQYQCFKRLKFKYKRPVNRKI